MSLFISIFVVFGLYCVQNYEKGLIKATICLFFFCFRGFILFGRSFFVNFGAKTNVFQLKRAALLLLLAVVASRGVAQVDSVCVADTSRSEGRVATVPEAKWHTGLVAFAELNALNAGIRMWDRHVLNRD